jgi:hypothetical protein
MRLAFRPLGNLIGITQTVMGRATCKYCDRFVPFNNRNYVNYLRTGGRKPGFLGKLLLQSAD